MKTPYCKLSHMRWKKAIKRIKKKKRYEDPLQPLGEYPHFLFHVCVILSQPQGLGEHIWIPTSVSARLRPQEIVLLSV